MLETRRAKECQRGIAGAAERAKEGSRVSAEGSDTRLGARCREFESPHSDQLVASDISLATSFFILLQSSSRAHSAAPRFQTEPASLGFGLGPPLRGGFV